MPQCPIAGDANGMCPFTCSTREYRQAVCNHCNAPCVLINCLEVIYGIRQRAKTSRALNKRPTVKLDSAAVQLRERYRVDVGAMYLLCSVHGTSVDCVNSYLRLRCPYTPAGVCDPIFNTYKLPAAGRRPYQAQHGEQSLLWTQLASNSAAAAAAAAAVLTTGHRSATIRVA